MENLKPSETQHKNLNYPWVADPSSLQGIAVDGMALATIPHVPANYRLTASLVLDSVCCGGFLLRLSSTLDAGYQLLIDTSRQRALMRSWEAWGDQPTVLERPLMIPEGRPLKVDAYLLGSILEVFFNDRVALTTRVYDHSEGGLGLFALNGGILIQDLEVATL